MSLNSLSPRAPWKRGLISAFIIFNIVAIFFGSSKPLSEQNPAERFFSPYLTWTRLLQHWTLFVPTPRKVAIKYRVDIKYRNGKEAVWRRPYPPNWDFFSRHLSYNFQKWDLASNYLDVPGLLWPDLETFIERNYRDDSNPIQTIALIRSKALWPVPYPTGYAFHDDGELRWHDQAIFTYHVAEKRFEE